MNFPVLCRRLENGKVMIINLVDEQYFCYHKDDEELLTDLEYSFLPDHGFWDIAGKYRLIPVSTGDLENTERE